MMSIDFLTYCSGVSMLLVSTATSLRLIMTARRPDDVQPVSTQLRSQNVKQPEIMIDSGEGNAEKLTRELAQATSRFAPQITKRVFCDTIDVVPVTRDSIAGDACSIPAPPNVRPQLSKEGRPGPRAGSPPSLVPPRELLRPLPPKPMSEK